MGAVRDVTEEKEAEERQILLTRELQHRVKNTLATVQSIVWQAARANSTPQAMREAVETRLFALSRSHDLLNRKTWQNAGLLDIVQDALEHEQVHTRVLSAIEIQEVAEGSGGAAAGLEAGDVVTQVDEKAITSTSSLVATIRGYRPGDTVTMVVERDGDTRTLTATLDSDAEASTP